jgi:hypothetical protein
MAANPSIGNPILISNAQRSVPEDNTLQPSTLLERTEEVLRKAFGDDDETIANSLRGL